LRLGWLVVPEWLAGPIVEAKRRSGADCSALEQLAFAELIRSRRYDRHLRRMRGIFRRRRDRFLAALDAAVPHLRTKQITAGLHFVVELPDGGPSESEVFAVARQAGVAVHGLQRCWHGPARSQGIIVGFGRPPEHDVDNAIRGLVEVLVTATRPGNGRTHPGRSGSDKSRLDR
jgi:GntR family transcriptional regulator / MocR family aminotransferase